MSEEDIKVRVTCNYSTVEEFQDLKAIETQGNKALEMVSKDHLQLAGTLFVPPNRKRVKHKLNAKET